MYYEKYKKYKTKYLELKYGGTTDDSTQLVTSIDYIKALFPKLDDEEKYKLIQIDVPSTKYISLSYNADFTTKLIIKHMKLIDLDPKDSSITDGTGGTGGNTLSFATFFRKVNSIEFDKNRSKYLENNVSIYGFTNVNVINGDTVEQVKKIEDQDVVFIDPPWGGSSYKLQKYVKLFMATTPIEDLCLDIFDSTKTKCVPKLIALKLPLNYDTKYFHSKLNKYKIKYYKLKKMLIIILTK